VSSGARHRRRALALAAWCALAIDPLAAAAEPARDLDAAYAALVAREPPRHLRTLIEEAASILGGTIWYWLDRERQVADWDYPSLGERLTFEAWRFDHNPFGINFIWHPIDGAGFHAIARSNHLGLLGAALYGFGTSMAWEYLLEFREKISINDVIVTPGAGIAMGEFFHWLGRYLQGAPPRGLGHQVARWTFAPLHAAHDALDGRVASEPGALDALGLPADIWHRFDVGLGLARATPDGVAAGPRLEVRELAIAGRLAALPGYRAPVRLRRRFADGNLTALAARIASSGDGVGLEVRADTMLLGYHAQDPTPGGGVRAVTIGAALALDYRRDRFGEFVDRVGLMHLPGPGLDLYEAGRGWHAAASLRAHLDLAGLHAAAYPAWRAAHPDLDGTPILEKQGYYYGWGGSLRAALELGLGPLDVAAVAAFGRFASIRGLDRNQEQIEDDVAAADDVLDLEVAVGVRPGVGPLRIELRAARARRSSEVGDVAARQGLDRASVAVGARF
jgi:hypothetical protein